MNTPRLLIDFQDSNIDSFIIEELTFNPYVYIKNKEAISDVWMEFSIRQNSNKKGTKKLPNIRLRYFNNNDDVFKPTTHIPEYIVGIEGCGDVNFIMYSDIWYSFVRLNGQDRDFMEFGYKKPLRVISMVNNFNLTESWITGNYKIFRSGKYYKQGKELFQRVKQFHEQLFPFDEKKFTEWENEKIPHNPEIDNCWLPNNKEKFAPVFFDISKSLLKGRFAVRRKSWHNNPHDKYGIGYGGTVFVTQKNDNESTLTPQLFSVESSKPIEAKLDKNELLRFWVHFKLKSCQSIIQSKSNRINFSMQIEIKPKIETFNTFFRIPANFAPLPGTITELLHYPTPPRLFYIWDEYFPEQCFADNKLIDDRNVHIELNSSFENKKTEIERIINVFIFSAFFSIVANLCVGLFLSNDYSSGIGSKTYFKFSLIIIIILNAISVIKTYMGENIKPFSVIICMIVFGFAGWLINDSLFFGIILGFSSLLIYSELNFKLLNILPLILNVFRKIMKPVIVYVEKRRYLKQLKGGSENVST